MIRPRKPWQEDPARWKRVRRAVLDRDGWRCRSCRRPGRLEVDHVLPRWKGGDPWLLEGCQALCRRCHFEKTERERRERVGQHETAWDRAVAEYRAELDAAGRSR